MMIVCCLVTLSSAGQGTLVLAPSCNPICFQLHDDYIGDWGRAEPALDTADDYQTE